MGGFWTVFFLIVVLKIPVIGSIWLVFWAGKQDTSKGWTESEDGGNFKRRKMPPKLPRGPRRGPHGGGAARPLPDCPPGRPNAGRQAGCRSPFTLAPDLAQIRMEVHLDRVTLRGDEALPSASLPRSRSPARIVATGGSAARPGDQVGDPFRLRLGQRHDRAERLDQADHVEAGLVDRDDPAVERQHGCPAPRAPRGRRTGR